MDTNTRFIHYIFTSGTFDISEDHIELSSEILAEWPRYGLSAVCVVQPGERCAVDGTQEDTLVPSPALISNRREAASILPELRHF